MFDVGSRVGIVEYKSLDKRFVFQYTTGANGSRLPVDFTHIAFTDSRPLLVDGLASEGSWRGLSYR